MAMDHRQTPQQDNSLSAYHPMGQSVHSNTYVPEAVGLFEDAAKLQDAIRELEATAFPRDAISVLGSRKQIEEKFGQATVDPIAAEDREDTPRQSPSRPEEQTIGAGVLVGCATYIGVVSAGIAIAPATMPLTLMAIMLGGGSGALVGSLMLNLIRRNFDRNIEGQIERGGLLLWVRTPDADREILACSIMRRNGGKNVHIHHVDE